MTRRNRNKTNTQAIRNCNRKAFRATRVTMAAHRLPDTLSSELCHALKRPAGSLFCTPTPPASKGGHKALRIALHAARRQTQQSTRARHHAVGATNPAANQPFGPPQREHSAAPRMHHAASDLSDPSLGSGLTSRSVSIVGCPLRNTVPPLSPHQLSCIVLLHELLRCLC